jgi:UDP-N-acetylglucosamine--N-acetylmuramyl-(pentapeptide) pyrophosphoryl-undecaprenol N-acetylglucosamine transferase
VLWQTGKLYADECVLKAQGYENVKAMPFISDMGLAYRAADIVVSRAGASTISELQLLGMAAILVPSPNVAEDHQRKNAQALADRDAAVMVLDADCREKLAAEVKRMLEDEALCQTMRANVLKMALCDADEKIVDAIYQILETR